MNKKAYIQGGPKHWSLLSLQKLGLISTNYHNFWPVNTKGRIVSQDAFPATQPSFKALNNGYKNTKSIYK